MIGLKARGNVIGALILRDMRTRFGRSHLGYLLAVAWPASHLLVMVGAAAYIRHLAPMGGDPAIFSATGILPYILCLYPARMMGQAMETNRQLLSFPAVKTLDIITSRAIVEFMTAAIVVILAFFVAAAIGIDIVPIDSASLIGGIFATIYFALTVGLLNNVMLSLSRMWMLVFILILLSMYFTSGALFTASALPQDLRDVLWYNPLFQSVEWLRSSYYEGYGDETLSRSYFLGVSTTLLLIGLTGERFLRGKLLNP
jgi:capsular polysaccharide transport system permease protein